MEELREMLQEIFLPLTRLQQIQGFLIYVARTYSWINLYLKGLHLTIDMWRPTRDKETGWPILYLARPKTGSE